MLFFTFLLMLCFEIGYTSRFNFFDVCKPYKYEDGVIICDVNKQNPEFPVYARQVIGYRHVIFNSWKPGFSLRLLNQPFIRKVTLIGKFDCSKLHTRAALVNIDNEIICSKTLISSVTSPLSTEKMTTTSGITSLSTINIPSTLITTTTKNLPLFLSTETSTLMMITPTSTLNTTPISTTTTTPLSTPKTTPTSSTMTLISTPNTASTSRTMTTPTSTTTTPLSTLNTTSTSSTTMTTPKSTTTLISTPNTTPTSTTMTATSISNPNTTPTSMATPIIISTSTSTTVSRLTQMMTSISTTLISTTYTSTMIPKLMSTITTMMRKNPKSQTITSKTRTLIPEMTMTTITPKTVKTTKLFALSGWIKTVTPLLTDTSDRVFSGMLEHSTVVSRTRKIGKLPPPQVVNTITNKETESNNSIDGMLTGIGLCIAIFVMGGIGVFVYFYTKKPVSRLPNIPTPPSPPPIEIPDIMSWSNDEEEEEQETEEKKRENDEERENDGEGEKNDEQLEEIRIDEDDGPDIFHSPHPSPQKEGRYNMRKNRKPPIRF